MRFHNVVGVIAIDFVNAGTNLVRRYIYKIISRTHGSSLGSAAHMVVFMSKKGLMEHGIHLVTCRKPSTASANLVMIRPGATYLSSSWSCEHILSRTKVTNSVRAASGMLVVRIEEGVVEFKLTRPTGRV